MKYLPTIMWSIGLALMLFRAWINDKPDWTDAVLPMIACILYSLESI